MPNRRRLLVVLVACAIVASVLLSSKQESFLRSHGRGRRGLEATRVVHWDLPKAADEWCLPSQHRPLRYDQCPVNSTISELQFIGGMTNSLKFVLLGAIMAYEENRCFVVNEQGHIVRRSDKSQALTAFTNRYFEPIGLQPDDPRVVKARKEGRIQKREWQEVWMDLEPRRWAKKNYTIPGLGYTELNGHFLKKIMMRRLWRPLPAVREETCRSLENYGLHDDFMTFGVRRGDKTIEGFEFTPLDKYITEAEIAIDKVFGGKVPKIFVATDDCRVMAKFRELRPEWVFVSECDNSKGINGFVLNDMKHWTLEQTDDHYRKFFVELYAAAIAKYFIGELNCASR